jgi:flagellar motor switch protein FliM
VTTDTTVKDGQLDDDILGDLDLDAALDDVGDLNLDLETAMQADSKAEDGTGPSSFDFNRPHSISKRFSKNLQNIAELLSRNATVNLTSMLRSNVMLDFQGIALRTYDEYTGPLPRTTCLATLSLRPLNGLSLVHMELNLCFVIIKKMMGGRPDSEDKVRPFTEIERGIIGHFLKRLLEMLRTSATKLIELHPEVSALENNPEYITGIPGGETMALMRFRLRLETVDAGIELAFPLSAFAPVRDVFDPEELREQRSAQERQQDQKQIMDLVQGTTSELIVHLGERSMSLDEILSLREGDLVSLNQAVDAPLMVLLEDQRMFLAEPGRVHQNRAVKLVRKIEKE